MHDLICFIYLEYWLPSTSLDDLRFLIYAEFTKGRIRVRLKLYYTLLFFHLTVFSAYWVEYLVLYFTSGLGGRLQQNSSREVVFGTLCPGEGCLSWEWFYFTLTDSPHY